MWACWKISYEKAGIRWCHNRCRRPGRLQRWLNWLECDILYVGWYLVRWFTTPLPEGLCACSILLSMTDCCSWAWMYSRFNASGWAIEVATPGCIFVTLICYLLVFLVHMSGDWTMNDFSSFWPRLIELRQHAGNGLSPILEVHLLHLHLKLSFRIAILRLIAHGSLLLYLSLFKFWFCHEKVMFALARHWWRCLTWTSLRLPLRIRAFAFGVSFRNWVNILLSRLKVIIIVFCYIIQPLLKETLNWTWVLGFTGQVIEFFNLLYQLAEGNFYFINKALNFYSSIMPIYGISKIFVDVT